MKNIKGTVSIQDTCEFDDADVNQVPRNTVFVDCSNLENMRASLIASLGKDTGDQMFSNLTGVHVIDGKLIASLATENDTIH